MARRTIDRSTDGAFELGGLPEGVHVVEARAEGFAPSFSEPFRTLRDSTTKDVVVQMTWGGSLTGLVLDASSGMPIAGAEVFPLENSWLSVGTGPGSEPVRVARWDVPPPLASGRFRIENVPPCTYRLSATRANPSDDPFETIGDIRRSELEIRVADGSRHELDLDLGAERR